MKKVLVCGGRDYADRKKVFDALDRVMPDCVVCGGASGADNLAVEWARLREVNYRVYPAKWRKAGRSAGPRRNAEMLKAEYDGLTGCIAFPGGRGTEDMVTRRRAVSVPVWDLRD